MPDRQDQPTVLLVVCQHDRQANGGVVSAFEIARSLRRFRVVVATNRRTKAGDALGEGGVKVIVDPRIRFDSEGAAASLVARRLSWIINLKSSVPAIVEIARAERAALIHANDLPSLYAATPAAKLLRLPLVWSIRGMTNVRGPRWRAGRLFADAVVTLSDDMKRAVEQNLAPHSIGRWAPVHRIYSIVDTARFQPEKQLTRERAREELGLPQDGPVVGLVGAFFEVKQQVELLREIGKQTDQKTIWCFAGDYQPEKNAYARAFQDLLDRDPALAERVRVIGYQSDVARVYAALDLTVISSSDEGLARCMIESLASAVPVVSFDVSSAREVLTEHEAGRVVPRNRFDQLLSEVQSLLAEPELRREMGERGRKLANRLFTRERSVEEYETLYGELLGRSG